jgi:hypothetical protein
MSRSRMVPGLPKVHALNLKDWNVEVTHGSWTTKSQVYVTIVIQFLEDIRSGVEDELIANR